MRYSRQNKIIELINSYEIDTQEKLASMLKEAGFEVTQATISRDIKELQLIKTLSPSGKYKYSEAATSGPISDRFIRVFRQTVLSVDSVKNMIIVKTLSGCANAAGEAIDTSSIPHIKGSLAGDNTLLVIVEDDCYVPGILDEFNSFLHKSDS